MDLFEYSLRPATSGDAAAALAAASAAQSTADANTVAIALKAARNRAYRAHTGTSDTSLLADAGNVVTSTNAAAVAQSVNQALAYVVDDTIEFLQLGAGQLTAALTSGTLIIPPGFLAKTRGVGCSLYVTKIASTTWKVSGDLATT